MEKTDDDFAVLLWRLNIRAYNVLQRERKCTAQDMFDVEPYDLLDIRGLVPMGVASIVVALAETWGSDGPSWMVDPDSVIWRWGPWFTGPLEEMHRRLKAMDDRPRRSVLHLGVVNAAKEWHRNTNSSTETVLRNQVAALLAFDKE